jgi:preprotein translocase subunit SecF
VRPQSKSVIGEQPLKKTILTFGLISGVISSLMMIATVPFMERIGSDRGYVLGYTTIILSLLLVFSGVRSYRDNVAKGQITFGKAFLVGLAITVISCLFYVATWEIIYFNFMPDFMDKYGAQVIQKMQASGATAAAIQQQTEQLDKLKVLYKNPFFNMAMTFIEPFPVGLVITFISAAFLRKKAPSQPAVAV